MDYESLASVLARCALCALLAQGVACGDDDGGDGAGDAGGSGGGGSDGGGDAESDGGEQGGGGDAESDGGEATDEPTLDELPSLLAGAVCAEVIDCFGDSITLRTVFGDEGCEARVEAELQDGDFHHLAALVESGGVTYDASRVQACLDEVRGLGCDFETHRLGTGTDCAATLVGSVELGDDCSLDEECVGDAFCRLGDGCPGTCEALLGAGEACEEDDQCEDGLACPDNTLRCTVPVAEGDDCEGGVAGQCGAGLVCAGEDEDAGTPGVCASLDDVYTEAEGEPCDLEGGILCQQGLSCAIVQQADENHFECVQPVDSGESCTFGVPAPCPDGEYCDAQVMEGEIEGTCVPLPSSGESCAETFGMTCAPGLFCESDETCRPVNRLGQPCVSDDGCASSACEDGSCVRPALCE